MTKLPALLVVALLAACATPPKVHEFEKSWTVPSTFDQTWTATVQLFAENGWSIATLEKDSGIIVSEWVDIGAKSDHADCGGAGIASVHRRVCKFNVFLVAGDGEAFLTVNAKFREHRSWDNRAFFVDCTSTGSLEAHLHEQIIGRIR